MKKKPAPQDDLQLISGIEQLKVLAHPDRIRMLDLLREDPLTASMLAEKLGIPANRANYHVQQLAKCGLIRLHATGRKRWKEERFFTSSARHFLVDPALACDDPRTADELLRTAESEISKWRRDEILQIDLGEVASRVVREMLRVRPGEHVHVDLSPATHELAEAIVVELEACGAHPHIKLWSWEYLLRTIERHDEKSLEELPFLDPEEDQQLSAYVHVSSTLPPRVLPTPEQRAQLRHRLEALTAWQRSLRDRKVRYVEVSLPHRSEFIGGALTVEEGLTTFWRSLESDPEKHAARARNILDQVWAHPELVFRGRNGTELTVEVDPELYRACDGVISDEDINEGRTVDNLPSGCLSLVPIRGTANGVFVAEYTYLRGRRYRDVRVEVEGGRLIEIDAAEGAEELRQFIADAVGEPDLLAEIAIGLNPIRSLSTGKAVLDSCLEGFVTMTFGNNELLGGDVHSTLTLNLPCGEMTLVASDTVILESGRFA